MNKEKIAEFIGMQSTNIGWFDNEGLLSKIEKDNTFDILKFDTDFNWLMAVVDLIEEMEINNNTLKLQSYDTIVAEYNKRTDEVKVFGWYSKTTKTHIDSFLSYLNVPAISKKDITDGKY